MRERPVLATVGSTAVIFLDNPLIKQMGEEESELSFLVLYVFGCGDDASWIASVRRFTCRLK